MAEEKIKSEENTKSDIKPDTKTSINSTTASSSNTTGTTATTRPKPISIDVDLSTNDIIEVVDGTSGQRINVLPKDGSIKMMLNRIYRLPIKNKNLTYYDVYGIKVAKEYFTTVSVLGVSEGYVYVTPIVNSTAISDTNTIAFVVV